MASWSRNRSARTRMTSRWQAVLQPPHGPHRHQQRRPPRPEDSPSTCSRCSAGTASTPTTTRPSVRRAPRPRIGARRRAGPRSARRPRRAEPGHPRPAREQAVEKLTRVDFARSLLQHNRDFYGFIRGGVPVEWRDDPASHAVLAAQVIDFRNVANNRFLAVRELKIQGVRIPHYNRRADLVCFVNGLPLVFIELKAVYKNIRAGFDDNLTDYLHEQHRPCVPPQRVPGRQQRRPRAVRLDHQQVGALRRVEAERREGRGQRSTPRPCSTACSHKTACSISSRTSSCSTTASRRHAQGRGAQPPGARREPGSRLGQEAGGAEDGSSRRRERHLVELPLARGRSCCSGQKRRLGLRVRRPERPAVERAGAPCRSSSAPTGPRPAGRVLAHAGQRQVVLDGVLRREGPPHGSGQLHLPA